ncbi:MAG: FGGY family carbohydrate kinase [Planctomycetota bacterium]|nr:FGGY family carbohydrate kinase [Planctomycetota bacterium]
MKILGLDVGSSSVKAGIVRDGKVVGRLARSNFPTLFDGPRVEVDPPTLMAAMARAITDLGPVARKVDAIGLSVMSPAWLAMDRRGKPLTPLITHQDRRSVEISHQLLARVGQARYLKIAGNLPFPGGISASTLAWFAANAPSVLRRADLVGHLNTYLHRQLTGERVIDVSNASFTGLYETIKQGGWSPSLCEAAGIEQSKLPQIFESNVIAGRITTRAARFGLVSGTPVFAGIIDTSAAMMLAGATPGQLLNVTGSTDVLGLCADRPRPRPNLLTRALGVGRLWMSVATLAATGSAMSWAKNQFFEDLSTSAFYKLISRLAEKPPATQRDPASSSLVFEPYLAGERASIDQKQASISGLTLSTTREDILAALIEALAAASGARLKLLAANEVRIRHHVITSGGAAHSLHKIIHRDWPGKWTFRFEDEASLRGLSMLNPVAR